MSLVLSNGVSHLGKSRKINPFSASHVSSSEKRVAYFKCLISDPYKNKHDRCGTLHGSVVFVDWDFTASKREYRTA
jgi:hypothetical protein